MATSTKKSVSPVVAATPVPVAMPSNVSAAARNSDAYLAEVDLSRRWIQAWADTFLPGSLNGQLSNDAAFVEMIVRIQKFVYGDEGDVAAGVAAQEATASEMDGIFGPGTRRRMETWEHAQTPEAAAPVSCGKGVDHLLWEGVPFEVKGVRVVTFQEEDGINLYRMATKKPVKWSASEKGHWSVLATDHWDVCTSAKKCADVLTSVGYSSNFGIDNPTPDGIATVYLWLDPGVFRGAHAGSPGNSVSGLSFDYSNAVDIGKYAKFYLDKVGQARPIIWGNYHGRKKQILGMYAGQVIAGMRMKKAYQSRINVPFIRPKTDDGMPFQAVLHGLGKGVFRGAVTHLNWTDQKWDVAGLVEQEIVLLLTYPQLQSEFPEYTEQFKLKDSKWQDWLAAVRKSWTWPDVFAREGVHPAVTY